jgi:cytochrome c556
MTRTRIGLLGGMALIILAMSLPGALNAADDALTSIAKRRALMRAQAAHAAAINDFVEKGIGDPAAVAANTMGLFATARIIPDLFPGGTGMDAYPGKTGAKPEIWADWKGFQAAAARLEEESLKLFQAAQTGDKQAIADQLAALAKNACSGCHTTFRQTLQ